MANRRTWYEWFFGCDNSYKGPTVPKPLAWYLPPPPPHNPDVLASVFTYNFVRSLGSKEKGEVFYVKEVGSVELPFQRCEFLTDLEFKNIVQNHGRIFRLELEGCDTESESRSFRLVPDNGVVFKVDIEGVKEGE